MRRWTLPLVPVLVVTALVAPARAVPETAPFPEYQPMVDAYVRDYPGIPLARARAAVLTQGHRTRMLEELGRSGAADFGASWYDPRTNVQHVLVTSDAAAANVRALAARHGVTAEIGRARYRLADLKALAARINAGVEPAARRSVFAIADTTTNRVKVIAQDRARADEARARHGRDARVVVLQSEGSGEADACTSRTACGTPFRSGLAIGRDYDASGPNSAGTSCSSGFTAVSNEGTKWLVTAGHCTGDTVDAGVVSYCGDGSSGGCWGHGGQWWGAMRDSQPYNNAPYNNVDVARARKDNTYWGTGGYIYNAGAPNSPFDVDGSVTSRLAIQVGDTVCQSMQHAVLGSYCGTITDTASLGWYGMVRASIDSCPGDSGGGWYQYTGTQRLAVGIHSQSASGCHVTPGFSHFSAMPDVYAYWDATSSLSPIRAETR